AIEAHQSLSLRSLILGESIVDRTSIRADDVAAWARAYDAGLVTWVVGADFAVVVHVAPNGSATAARIEISRKSLAAAVRRFREALTAGEAPDIERLRAEIADALLPALVRTAIERATTRDASRLLCLLHGPLEELPVEALGLGGGRVVPLVLPGLPDKTP